MGSHVEQCKDYLLKKKFKSKTLLGNAFFTCIFVILSHLLMLAYLQYSRACFYCPREKASHFIQFVVGEPNVRGLFLY